MVKDAKTDVYWDLSPPAGVKYTATAETPIQKTLKSNRLNQRTRQKPLFFRKGAWPQTGEASKAAETSAEVKYLF